MCRKTPAFRHGDIRHNKGKHIEKLVCRHNQESYATKKLKCWNTVKLIKLKRNHEIEVSVKVTNVEKLIRWCKVKS